MTDFFSKLDDKIAELRQDQALNENCQSASREFFEMKIPELLPKVEDFVAELVKRDIQAENTSGNRRLGLKLTYRNRNTIELNFVIDHSSGRLIHKTNHWDSKRWYSENGSYEIDNWKDSILESSMKALVNDYLLMAKKYGGI